MDSKKNRIGNISDLLSDKLHTDDFWEWYASYSIDSSVRGALAEFLVM